MIVWQVFPGVPVRAVVFPHSAPCAFAEVGSPTLPVLFARGRLGQSKLLFRQEILYPFKSRSAGTQTRLSKPSPWRLKFCEPLGLASTSRTINGSRYSSSRASVVVRALRIMPLFIGISLLLLFDLHAMAIGVTFKLSSDRD